MRQPTTRHTPRNCCKIFKNFANLGGSVCFALPAANPSAKAILTRFNSSGDKEPSRSAKKKRDKKGIRMSKVATE